MVSVCEVILSQLVWAGVWSTHLLRNSAANLNADLTTEVRHSRCRFLSLLSDQFPALMPSAPPQPSFSRLADQPRSTFGETVMGARRVAHPFHVGKMKRGDETARGTPPRVAPPLESPFLVLPLPGVQ